MRAYRMEIQGLIDTLHTCTYTIMDELQCMNIQFYYSIQVFSAAIHNYSSLPNIGSRYTCNFGTLRWKAPNVICTCALQLLFKPPQAVSYPILVCI